MLALTLTGTGCSAAPAPVSPPPAGAVFDYQLGGAYDPPAGVQVVVRDREDAPAPGAYSICYVNGFQTQPGESASWPESLLLTHGGEPVIDPAWPDEVLLDTSSPDHRRQIAEVVGDWIRGCADDGFDGVEVDNLDSFSRSDGALSAADNLALAVDLVASAHAAGLAIAQKNAAELAPRLHDEAGFDFAVAEECSAFDECAQYTEVYGQHVLAVEYTDALPRAFRELCADPLRPEAMILRDRDLVTPADPAYVFERC